MIIGCVLEITFEQTIFALNLKKHYFHSQDINKSKVKLVFYEKMQHKSSRQGFLTENNEILTWSFDEPLFLYWCKGTAVP